MNLQTFAAALRTARFTLVSFLLVCSMAVYAQAVDVIPVTPDAAPWSWQGNLMIIALVVVLGLLSVALGVWITFTAKKAKESAGWSMVNKASLAAQLAFHRVESELSPLVKEAMKDGTIDAAEMAAIKAKGVEVAKGLIGDGLAGLPAFLGFTNGSIGDVLAGMIAKLASGFTTPTAPVVPSVTVQNNVQPAPVVAPAVPI